MIRDVFNNSTNNYIKTGLSPCDAPTDNIFQFLPKEEVGISNGSNVLEVVSLGDIQIAISEWEHNRKTISPLSVIYIPGLSKEPNIRTQVFLFGENVSDASIMYMGIDLSVNYYSGFKYKYENVSAVSDPSTGISIDNAIDISFNSAGINIVGNIDSSTLIFTGKTEGYDYSIDNVQVTYYDQAMMPISIVSMEEDTTRSIPYAKYSNGAMLGVILKMYYPDTASTYDKWLQVNHVSNEFGYYDFDTSSYVTKKVDVGLSGSSTTDTMSAGDYLNYITENNMWYKVGYLMMKINTFDPSDINNLNLVKGFYVYNPHDFAVDVEYLLIG